MIKERYSPDMYGGKILIVDSSVQSTDLMSQCLENNNFEIFTSESGFNALGKISLFKPDLIIIDVDLPDVSGFDVCKKVKSNPETEYILVLLTSVLETRDLRIRAVEVGADDYIEKPFDAYILISKCKSLLRIKHLSNQLKLKYNELEENNKMLDFQLKTARQVQRSLIPSIDMNEKSLQIISNYLPALYIGGDFLDVIQLNDSCISIVMGDVSGHGISAALLTAMISVMIKNLVQKYFNPDQLLFYFNQEFCKIFENSRNEMYACVFYTVIDTKEKKIYYSNAGQALPIYINSAQGKAMELEASGTPIGLIKNSRYEFKSFKYNPGDLILFHTDGLSDTFYKNNPDEFSARIKELLLDSYQWEDNKEIISNILDNFYIQKEEKSFELDDVSIVLVKMLQDDDDNQPVRSLI